MGLGYLNNPSRRGGKKPGCGCDGRKSRSLLSASRGRWVGWILLRSGLPSVLLGLRCPWKDSPPRPESTRKDTGLRI